MSDVARGASSGASSAGRGGGRGEEEEDEEGQEEGIDGAAAAAQRKRRAAQQRQKKRALRERNLADLAARLVQVADAPGAWFPDLLLRVGPDRVPLPAHRVLLAASSPVLHALLLSLPPLHAAAAAAPTAAGGDDGTAAGQVQQQQPLQELELPDVEEPEAFRLMLRFVYAGALPAGGLSSDVGLHLLRLAERYEIPALAALCLDKYVRKVISQENAFDLFAETYTEHKHQISFECLYFIEEHFAQLLKHNREGFRKLPEEVLIEILKSDRLSVGDEYMLFLALQDWATAALAREQPDLAANSAAHTAALRERLAKLFEHIRFPMMSPQGLEEAEKTGLIAEHLLYEAFRHHVLLRDGVVSDKESDDGDDSLEQQNPRLRRRKYHTYFLWDPTWHGQNIQIEDKGRTVRKIKAGWYSLAIGTTPFSTGKHYWEIKINGHEFSVGVVMKSLPSSQLDNFLGASTDGWAYEAAAHRKRGGVRTAYGESYGIGDQIGVLLDLEQNQLSFYRNGKSMGVAFTDLPSGTPLFAAIGWRDGSATIVPAWCCSMDL